MRILSRKNQKKTKLKKFLRKIHERKEVKKVFSQIGPTEIIIIALLILIFFGGKKLPEFIRGIGEAIKEFHKGAKEDK